MADTTDDRDHERAVEHALDPHPFVATEAFVEADEGEPVELMEEEAARLRDE